MAGRFPARPLPRRATGAPAHGAAADGAERSWWVHAAANGLWTAGLDGRTQRWETPRPLARVIGTSPAGVSAIDADARYVSAALAGGLVVALDARTGRVLSSYREPPPRRVVKWAVIDGDTVLTQNARDPVIRRLSLPSLELLTTYWGGLHRRLEVIRPGLAIGVGYGHALGVLR